MVAMDLASAVSNVVMESEDVRRFVLILGATNSFLSLSVSGDRQGLGQTKGVGYVGGQRT
jgi:hypothetical protein